VENVHGLEYNRFYTFAEFKIIQRKAENIYTKLFKALYEVVY
jgi:hypothetical protein